MLTVSDGVSQGTREDASGELAASMLEEHGFRVVERRVIPDGADPVAEAIADLAPGTDLVVTTGGTGLGTFVAVISGSKRLTDSRHRLRLDRLSPKREG